MAYSKNILPRSGAYYSLSRASIVDSDLILEADGYAEIQISTQMLPSLTDKMLVVVHPSVFSDFYTSDAVKVTLSIITADGERIEYVISASEDASGVFNTEVTLPEGTYTSFIYRVSSSVPVTIYNWELCPAISAELTTVIDGVEQTIPKLLYDYNTYAYAVGQKEITVGLISCYLQSATDLQGHFTISFFSTERCNVHVRIKDNNVTELFSPQVYTVEKGYASVSIPHAYLKKLSTTHSFSVTMQCTNGQLSIPVRGMLYTIDGGYLATRLLDAGIEVEDISIRQLDTDESPSEIWAIGFEGNRLILKNREYSQQSFVNWNAVKDFGEAREACIEFYGRWVSRRNSIKHTIETDKYPFVFIVDTNGTLNVRTGEDFSSIIELDTNVSSISACQGFNSMIDIDQDQGLIVTYIKNGNAYYRQYMYDTSTEANVWFPATPVYSSGDASFISVHRLPDYRVGICVRHSTGTKWYITDRTYVTQAVKPESVESDLDAITVTSVYDTSKAPPEPEYAATQNVFEEATTYNGFTMAFEGPLVFLNGTDINDLKRYITASVGNTSVEIESVTIVDNVLEVYLKEDVPGSKTVTISYNFYPLVMRAYNGCFAVIKKSYTWQLPSPTIRASISELAKAQITPTLSAMVLPITTRRITQATEYARADITASVDAIVREIKTSALNVSSENVNGYVTSTVSAIVTLVGTSPI